MANSHSHSNIQTTTIKWVLMYLPQSTNVYTVWFKRWGVR